jgi:tRNA splicing endonuclease
MYGFNLHMQKSHLRKMGMHRPDGDFLTIEEALYLSELGAALVLDQGGNPLAIQQVYSILGQQQISALRFGFTKIIKNVSFWRYAIFAHLIRAGYIVRRPRSDSFYDYELFINNSAALPIYRVVIVE